MKQTAERGPQSERLIDLTGLLTQGLFNADPAIRKQSAEGLGRNGSSQELPALHEANRRETDLNSKLEILKAINLLEERSLLEESAQPLACPI